MSEEQKIEQQQQEQEVAVQEQQQEEQQEEQQQQEQQQEEQQQEEQQVEDAEPQEQEEEEEEEEELVDPMEKIRERCRDSEHCAKYLEKFNKCEERVARRPNTTEDCEEELFDLLHCRDHCAAKEILKHTK